MQRSVSHRLPPALRCGTGGAAGGGTGALLVAASAAQRVAAGGCGRRDVARRSGLQRCSTAALLASAGMMAAVRCRPRLAPVLLTGSGARRSGLWPARRLRAEAGPALRAAAGRELRTAAAECCVRLAEGGARQAGVSAALRLG